MGRVVSILAIWRLGRVAWRLLWDRRVPVSTKLLLPAALLYALFPVDLLPDFFLALGQLDDLTVLLIAMTLFVRLCPQHLVREHLDRMAGRQRPERREDGSGKVIEGDYEVLD